ncbi:MAG: hypothetical protein RLZZ466_693, partial [Bacteroidota bacterium]
MVRVFNSRPNRRLFYLFFQRCGDINIINTP